MECFLHDRLKRIGGDILCVLLAQEEGCIGSVTHSLVSVCRRKNACSGSAGRDQREGRISAALHAVNRQMDRFGGNGIGFINERPVHTIDRFVICSLFPVSKVHQCTAAVRQEEISLLSRLRREKVRRNTKPFEHQPICLTDGFAGNPNDQCILPQCKLHRKRKAVLHGKDRSQNLPIL